MHPIIRPLGVHLLGILFVLAFLVTARPAIAQEAVSLRRGVRPAAVPPGGGPDGLAMAVPAEPKLDPIVLSPNVEFAKGHTAGGLVPVVTAQGETKIQGAGLSGFAAQFRVTLKPTPATSSADEVAQQVKINAGLASASLGLRYSYFPVRLNPGTRGNLGIDARIAARAAFQRTQNTEMATGQVVTADFGLFNPEAVVGIWLVHAYLGYAYSHYWTFGDGDVPVELKSQVNTRNMHRFLLSIPVQVTDKDSGAVRTFYMEPSYAADSAAFGSGSFIVNIGVALSPL